jgi:phage terminase large subunit-like protein
VLTTDNIGQPQPARKKPPARARGKTKRPPSDGEKRAQRVIDFIEQLTVPSGKGQGKPFVLRGWQRDFIKDIYEPHTGGRRTVRRAILSMARKNGKTALIAAIALAHLVGPEAIVHGEIYSAANDRDQAARSAQADRDH